MEKGRKRVRFLPIAILTLILIVAGVGLGYAMMDTSAKKTYLKAESHTWQEVWDQIAENNKDAFKFLEEQLNADAVTREENISVKLDLEGAKTDPTLRQIQDIVNRWSVQMINTTNQKDKTIYGKIGLLQDNQSLLNLEIHQSPEYTGLRIKELYEQTLKLKNNEFGNLMRKFDPEYNDIESLYTEPMNIQDYVLTEDEGEYLKEKYGKLLYDALKEDYFTIEKNALQLEKDGEVHQLDKVSLKLSEAQLQAILTNLLSEIKKDEKLYTMIETRIFSVAKAVGEENIITKQELKQSYHDVFTQLLESVQSLNLPKGMVSNLFINGDQYIEKREIILGGADAGANLQFTSMPMKNNQEWFAMNLEVVGGAQTVGIILDEMQTKKGSDLSVKGELKLYSGEDNLVLAYDGVGDDKRLKLNYDAKYTQKNSTNDFEVAGTLDMITPITESEVGEVKMTADVKTPLQNFGLALNYDYKTIFTDAGAAFEQEVKNGQDIMSIDSKEWMAMQETVINNGMGILSQTDFMKLFLFSEGIPEDTQGLE